MLRKQNNSQKTSPLRLQISQRIFPSSWPIVEARTNCSHSSNTCFSFFAHVESTVTLITSEIVTTQVFIHLPRATLGYDNLLQSQVKYLIG